MMKHLKYIIALSFVFAVAACDQGPAERAGENIDEAVNDAGRSIEDAGENVDRSMNN